MRLQDARKYDEADEIFKQGIARFPNSWLTYQLAINMMMEKRKLSEARSLLEEFRGRRPESPLPYLGLGYLARTNEDWSMAHQYALEALNRSTPADWRVRMYTAALLFQIRGAEQQVRDLLEELAQTKGEPTPHLYLAVLLEHSVPHESEKHFRKALTMIPVPEERLRGQLETIRENLPE
jgi:predicted Zn-dependent protease